MSSIKARVAFELSALGVGKATNALKKVSSRFQKIESRLTKVNERYKQQETILSRVKEKFNKVALSAVKAGFKLSGDGVNGLRRFNIGVHKANKSLIKMKRHFKDTKRSLSPLLSGLDRVGKKVRAVGLGLTLGVTSSLGIAGGSAIKASANFESAMNKVEVLTKGVSFEALEKEAMRLGATTAFSATEAGDAMSYLAMAGFNSNQILGSMAPTLNLASAGGLDLARSADIVSNVMTGYGISVDKITQSTDSLVGAFTESNTSLDQLGESLKVTGPIASSLNIPLNETLSIIGAMGNAGFQGERSGTALAGGLSRLIKPVKEVSVALKNLGIDSKDILGKNSGRGSLIKFLELLERKGAKTEDYLRIFGQEAGKAFIALKKQGSSAIRELEKKITNSTGRAKEIAKAMNKGANGAIKSLVSAFEGLQIAIAKSGLLDWFTKLTKKAALIVRKLSKLNPVLLRYGTIIGLVAAAIGPLLLIFSSLIFSVGKMIFVFKFLGPLVLGAAKVMAIFAIKAIAVVAAIGALGYAWWFLIKNFKKIIGLFQRLWKLFKVEILSILEVIDPTGGVIARSFEKLGNNIMTIIDTVRGAFKDFVSYITNAWNSIAPSIGKDVIKLDVVEDKTETLRSKVVAEISASNFDFNPIEGITGEFSEVYDALKNPFTKDSTPAFKVPNPSKNVIPFPTPISVEPKKTDSKASELVVSSIMPQSFGGRIGTENKDMGRVSSLFSRLKTSFDSLLSFNDNSGTRNLNSTLEDGDFSFKGSQKEKIEITVDFKNVPKGTNIDLDNPFNLPVRINQGLALDREFG